MTGNTNVLNEMQPFRIYYLLVITIHSKIKNGSTLLLLLS